jgi:hypothetical protein
MARRCPGAWLPGQHHHAPRETAVSDKPFREARCDDHHDRCHRKGQAELQLRYPALSTRTRGAVEKNTKKERPRGSVEPERIP